MIRTSLLGLVRHVALGLDLLDKSCNVDVEDETLSELVDNPGTTGGTKLFVLHTVVFPSLEAMEQQAFLRALALSRINLDVLPR